MILKTSRIIHLLFYLEVLSWTSPWVFANPILGVEDVILNITRLEDGDAFYISGGDCGVTRCNEVSGGTALSSRPPGSGPPCICKCRPQQPLFREDLLHCVNDISECPLADFGSGESASKVPFVFIPLSGQIVHPSKDIIFPDAKNAICAVSGAQYLTKTGWSNLRNDLDGDVPFSLYRDEGKTFLQWRGTESTRARVTGRVVLTRLTCRSGPRVFIPCAAFRVPGSPAELSHDMTEVWFSHGELSSRSEDSETPVETSSMGGAAGVTIILCALLAMILYGALLLIHLRNKAKRPPLIDSESPSFKDDTLPNTKTNPLLSIETFFKETQGSSFDGLATRTDTISTSSKHSDKSSEHSLENKENDDVHSQAHDNCSIVTNVTVHHQKKKTVQRDERSVCSQIGNSVERIPELHISIVETPGSVENQSSDNDYINDEDSTLPVGPQRKKLYFNPAFFEIQHLKMPPPAAVEFLLKIREVITIAKDKMLSKRFIPVLPSIPEEEFLRPIEIFIEDKELPFPYENLSKNHAAFSLKRENNRRKSFCSGCPGCTDMKFKKTYLKTMSEKEFCKDCVSNEFKQNIVRKWLEEVPLESSNKVDTLKQYRKSIARVSGTPNSINPNSLKTAQSNSQISKFQDKVSINITSEGSIKRMTIPPPPPPQITKGDGLKRKEEEDYIIPQELKEKMNAVINELSKFRKIEPIQPRASSPITEVVTPFIPNSVIAVTPKLVIPTPPKYAKHNKPKVMLSESELNHLNKQGELPHFEVDSLERSAVKRRASLSNIDYNGMKAIENERIHKRRSSIIAMEELEPMKKIYEMNSRLSRSFQEMSVASLAWDDELHRLQDAEKFSQLNYSVQPNLVSEVYINDKNTVAKSSDQSSRLLKVKYVEPLTKPGQLVIEVEGPPKRRKIPDYEDFDPDTLDRKPGKLKLHQDICLTPPISPNKTIDKIFMKMSENYDRSSPIEEAPKLKVGSLLEIFEAKTRQNRSPSNGFADPCHLNMSPDVLPLVSISPHSQIDEYKPALPPKKVIGRRNEDYKESSLVTNTSPEFLTPTGAVIKFRTTRSEPYSSMPRENSENHFSTCIVSEKRKFTTFSNLNAEYNGQKSAYNSLDPNYENYCNTDEIDFKYCKSLNKEDTCDRSKGRLDMINLKRPGRRSGRPRVRRIEHNKTIKTEDSGYLSSDSNESRQKGKFILQVRDKSDVKDTISDTDDLDSIGDAHSESGGESIETNSVFFGSYRRLSLMGKGRMIDVDQVDDSGFQGDHNKIDDDHARSLRNGYNL